MPAKIKRPISWRELCNFKDAGFTYVQIASMYGVSRQRIHQIYVRLGGTGKGRKKRTRTVFCKRCGKAFVNEGRQSRQYCKYCFSTVKATILNRTKRTDQYKAIMAEIKKRWWAEHPEQKEKLSVRSLEYWKKRKGEQNGL